MTETDNKRKEHWENVYDTKGDREVSWYQEAPTTSLDLIVSLNLNKDASIIDIGGGNSNLTGELLKKGYTNLSVLDISTKSLERTKAKLGQDAGKVDWVVSDILDFKSKQQYDLWHDRATFHFLTSGNDIAKYVDIVNHAVKKGGYMIIATFSTSGPTKCSGLDITQYTKEKLKVIFNKGFELIKAFEEVHHTPFNTNQNFIYTLFKKL